MGVYQKLAEIQVKLKCKKSQYNSFGKYYYRNAEDILEAAKPLLSEVNAALTISDEIINIENRFYIKATAKLIDTENGEYTESTAFAREPENKKGLDESQITGSTSSYARKYALNGLFAIDDNKDSDYSPDQKQQQTKQNKKITPKQLEILKGKYTGENLVKLLEAHNIDKLENLSLDIATKLISKIMSNK